jgi:hypothetical protein
MKIILLTALWCLMSCVHTVKFQKSKNVDKAPSSFNDSTLSLSYDEKIILDTTHLLINWYDYFVHDFKQKFIELIELPYSINIENKYYYTYDEVESYYLKFNKPDELNSFLSVSRNELSILKENLKRSNTLKALSSNQSLKPLTLKDDYLIFYYNKGLCAHGRDMLSNESCIEKLNKKIRISLYGIDTTVESLIFSDYYNSNANDSSLLPNGLAKLLIKSLSETKKLLPHDKYEKVKDFEISFEKNNVTLWVSTLGKTIYLSPFLIRAAYLYTIVDNKLAFDYCYSRKAKLTSLFKEKTPLEIKDINDILIQQFKESFYFILGHELAHGYLDEPIADINTEKRCDCYSYRYMKPFEPGIYQTILEKTIENGYTSLWGVSRKGDLEERFNYLKTLSNDSDCVSTP